MPILTENEHICWQEGIFSEIYKKLGACVLKEGVCFRLWAPHAQEVYVTGDFNQWGHSHPMQKDPSTGIWETIIRQAQPGQRYKFAITPLQGSPFLKTDPYAFRFEKGQNHAAIIAPLPAYDWKDEQWLTKRAHRQQQNQALSIYEVHFGSWKRTREGSFLSYRQMTEELLPYVKKMGFTHIELMPMMEHPYLPSWGYQITGYYAPTNRYGSPEDFMAFVDTCHRHGIGLILDWVPGHFPRDNHGLAFFDGSPLYEHDHPYRRLHPDWNTHIFDFDKPEVRSFLLSNARFWCEYYHIDGIRVDAVASMLYLDYSRSDGQWLANAYGGKENLGAIALLQDLNSLLHEQYPSVITIAEESSGRKGITTPIDEGGLGFDYSWNMGWMNDTLHYFSLPPDARSQQSHSITFPRTYMLEEAFILPLSHDEVVHLKQSLWGKMPGNDDRKFAQLKLLLLYMIGYPGKKLLFMGSELAEKEEWSESRALNWALLDDSRHQDIQQFLKRLNHWYAAESVLHQANRSAEGFQWADLSHKEESVFSFIRKNDEHKTTFLLVFNFSEKPVKEYTLPLKPNYSYSIICNTVQNPAFLQQPEVCPSSLLLNPFQGIVIQGSVS